MEAIGKDLVDFWNWTADKGLVHRDTAGGLRSACKTVLSTVEPEGWETLDLRQIDVEPFLTRFERLKQGVKPQSLRVYQARFRSGLASYLSYLESPSIWQFQGRAAAGAENNGEVRRRARPAKAPRPTKKASERVAAEIPPAVPPPAPGMITHQVPLRPNLIIPVTLPVNLTKSDVSRMNAFLSAVAFDSQEDSSPQRPTPDPEYLEQPEDVEEELEQ